MTAGDNSAIWACFSVFDHVQPGAFLAEVVKYDHLVVPVPPKDKHEEWER